MRVVVDHHQTVLLDQRPCAHLRTDGNPLGVRNFAAAAVAIPEPGMEGATDAATVHLAAVAEVRAEMPAVRVEHGGHALGVAEEHEIAAEEMQGADVADRQLVCVGGAEPAIRVGRERKATLHACLAPRPADGGQAESDGASDPTRIRPGLEGRRCGGPARCSCRLAIPSCRRVNPWPHTSRDPSPPLVTGSMRRLIAPSPPTPGLPSQLKISLRATPAAIIWS